MKNITHRKLGLILAGIWVILGLTFLVPLYILYFTGFVTSSVANAISLTEAKDIDLVNYVFFIIALGISTLWCLKSRSNTVFVVSAAFIILSLTNVGVHMIDPIGQYIWSMPVITIFTAAFLSLLGHLKEIEQ